LSQLFALVYRLRSHVFVSEPQARSILYNSWRLLRCQLH
jgi:hypothetical protein